MPLKAAVIACLLAYVVPLVRGQSVGMSIAIVQPAPGALSSDGLNIVVKVASTFELEGVTASVETRQSVCGAASFPLAGWSARD